ncbi:CDP-alcohol phosphatidyltransferase family protein [uncultured Sphingomonas sp.]|uniref:CDP-alcohol phosphatidyltransferase family protein n=1 Tax=uncultured Sphingomonas sp. TaxID=158754 RepID=UPI0025F9C299|nr:CDP-alcohol phosphatidyltransferase family protein [uncultured Sphingomonas sp.]
MLQSSRPVPSPAFLTIGNTDARLFGQPARERAERLAANAGLSVVGGLPSAGPVLLGNLAYAWDPAWLKELARRPGTALVKSGVAVLVHASDQAAAELALAVMGENRALPGDEFEVLDADTAQLSYFELRKRERPFAMPLAASNSLAVERAYYDAAYKGVTDLLTLYLWRRPAFWLTRWAAMAGLTPNVVTLVGFVFCAAAFWLFWEGHYWAGFASGFVFMVLDTVDGKLARCTGQSSKWGDVLDHGVDLLHPPFWWWAWVHGLGAAGHQIEEVYKGSLLAVIVGTYVLGRIIEGWFKKRFGMHIHVWRPIDSRFRLVTARRNPNMLILFFALLLGRPDVGIELVALWSVVSLIFHAVRLAQAETLSERGGAVVSWLD